MPKADSSISISYNCFNLILDILLHLFDISNVPQRTGWIHRLVNKQGNRNRRLLLQQTKAQAVQINRCEQAARIQT